MKIEIHIWALILLIIMGSAASNIVMLKLADDMLTTGREAALMKELCEENLPRSQQCIMTYVPVDE